MLTILLVVTNWVRRLYGSFSLRHLRIPNLVLWGLAGVLIGALLIEWGNRWPNPTTELDLSNVINANSLGLEDDWKGDDHDQTSFNHHMNADIPHELHPESNYISRKPLLIASVGLPSESKKNMANTKVTPHSQASHPSPTPKKKTETPPPLPKVQGVYHHVKSGENPWLLAKLYDVSLEKISKYNPTLNPNRLMVGDKLFIPDAKKPLTYSRSTRMVYPLRSSRHITSGYGNRKHPLGGGIRFHKGVDFSAKTGTPVQAVLDGLVIEAGYRGLLGLVVTLRHDNGLETVYAHNSRLRVKVGQRVKQGDTISHVGRTGRTTGPHLHFEILKNGRHQNPEKYLRGSKSRYARR